MIEGESMGYYSLQIFEILPIFDNWPYNNGTSHKFLRFDFHLYLLQYPSRSVETSLAAEQLVSVIFL